LETLSFLLQDLALLADLHLLVKTADHRLEGAFKEVDLARQEESLSADHLPALGSFPEHRQEATLMVVRDSCLLMRWVYFPLGTARHLLLALILNRLRLQEVKVRAGLDWERTLGETPLRMMMTMRRRVRHLLENAEVVGDSKREGRVRAIWLSCLCPLKHNCQDKVSPQITRILANSIDHSWSYETDLRTLVLYQLP
jgi:hypothetical protein